jgi:hypothetical protein
LTVGVCGLSLLCPVSLEQCGDPVVVLRAVEFVEEVVGAEFVEVAPPAAGCVVPDPVAP